VAVFSRYLALGLLKRGHEIHVVCPATKFANYTENDDGIIVHRVKAIKNPFRPKLKVSFLPKAEIAKLFVELKPDIVHLQDPTGISSQVLKQCHKHHVPVVATNHFSFDYVLSYLPLLKPFHPLLSKILEQYLVKFYNQCSYLTFPSETIREEFKSQKLITKSEAVSNGVNLDQFFPSFNFDDIRLKYHLPNNPIVLHVGRLDQDKSASVILDAFFKIKPSLNAHLVVVGDGNDLKKLKALAAENHAETHVTFTGFVGHDELPKIYQLSSVFITASTIETQGIVALEAMASGLPIIAPNAGALPELVQEGVNGFLFKADDAKELAHKIDLVLANTDNANKMGEKSLEIVEKHQVDKSYDTFENIYNLVTQKKK
jgi:1,2-diacylglycerol 3-alpha-glucosyltransferase